MSDEVDEFFALNDEPALSSSQCAAIESFIGARLNGQSRVALVSSGGTRAPLEKNTVRSVDNFSTGLRGAACAEWLLRAGYAVIYFHRVGCALPFERRLMRALTLNAPGGDARGVIDALHTSSDGSSVQLVAGSAPAQALVAETAVEYQAAKKRGSLLYVQFDTVVDHMYSLRRLLCALAPLGPRAALVAAAAVSDYYVLPSAAATHKLPSSRGSLTITLAPTPKLLTRVRVWAPHVFFVSFKLETDESVLLAHARAAARKYGTDAVVCNELNSRYRRITLLRHDTRAATAAAGAATLAVDGAVVDGAAPGGSAPGGSAPGGSAAGGREFSETEIEVLDARLAAPGSHYFESEIERPLSDMLAQWHKEHIARNADADTL